MRKFAISILILFMLHIKVYAEQINVAFTFDSNYAIPAMITINSILKNNKSNSEYMFYVIEDNLSEKDKKRVENFVKKQNQKIKFIHFSDTLLQCDSQKYFNSTVIMARLMLPKLLPESVEKIIYLDTDLVVNADLKELYNIDLENNYAAMAMDEGTKKGRCRNACGFKFTKGYHNSGVILMDLKKWREDKISDKIITYVQNNKDKFIQSINPDNCVFDYPDQDLINIVLYTRIKLLDEKWNQQNTRIYHAYIYHFIGRKKPWLYENESRTIGRVYYYKYWYDSSLKKYKYYYMFKLVKNKYTNMCRSILDYYKSALY